ncbi:helix-turn-helix domain-containing protein [Bradyrhizobium australiense]|uniref:Helix-turn-helix domain-containing protein n=1 Tax=Bradyrhizobium australiense TaxID=2721161 RepID=A0A7Y4LWB4_9BRAD|nr:helix-turn-helix domain-containing protein [Bradyrhizobium australiense]NOJ41011.1 helix-turn-helix domain-containing protein [Bradyrhizobium australiense]
MTKTIRSLERGLQALKALHATPISSLHDIYEQTRIPKPTLLRILLTLEQSGLVSRRLADGRYRISSGLTRLGRKRDRYDRVAETAAPVLDRLCQKVSWPSDFMVPAGDHLEIRESSRTHSPFMIYVNKDRIGTPVNWLLSAVGRAYLAYCPESERKKVIALLRKSDRPENWLAKDPARLDAILSETKKRGYGLRDQTFAGGAYGTQSPDGLAGIAVPLLDRGRVHGVINIIWPKPARTVEEIVTQCLPSLQAAAAEIVNSLRKRPNMT